MPSRPDLRDIASNVKDAFADADRESLLDILTFVIKEYVVEGPPPMLIHQAETLADLKGASFAQLISAMQTRFDHPELAMFVVDGEQVSVRIGGVVQPLLAARQPQDTAAELPRPQAGVRVVESTLQPRPAPAAPPSEPAAARTAPPPSRGISLRGQPTTPTSGGAGGSFGPGGGGSSPSSGAGNPPASRPAAAPPQPAASSGAPPSPAPAAPEKDSTGGDDASARFSLLELD